MTNTNIEKLSTIVQELKDLVIDVPWSEKWKMIELKDKSELMMNFSIDEPEKAEEVKNEIEEFIKDVDQLIVDLKKELAVVA